MLRPSTRSKSITTKLPLRLERLADRGERFLRLLQVVIHVAQKHQVDRFTRQIGRILAAQHGHDLGLPALLGFGGDVCQEPRGDIDGVDLARLRRPSRRRAG